MTPAMRFKLRGLIMSHEAWKAMPYYDEFGNLTIGYGHKLSAHGIPLSTVTGGALLDDDIQWFMARLEAQYPWFATLDDPRKCVLVDMAYNLGMRGLSEFVAMLDALAHGKYGVAADQMLASEWARQVGDRAIQDAHIMRTGEI